MSPNIVTQFVVGTPPITRILVFLIVLTTLLVYLNVLQPHQLTYSRFYIPKLQLHRAVTTFLYFGRLNLEIALHIVFLYRYSLMLEESFTRTSDYFYMLLVISALLFVLSNVYYIPLLGPSLSCTITYIWTRKNPQTVVQIMGFVSFYAFYLPFIVPMFTLVFEGKISMEEIVGIIVGHIVYYLQDVYPRFGRTVLTTPCWCHRLFNERGPCCSGARRIRPRASQRLGDIQVSREVPEELQADQERDISACKEGISEPSNADSSYRTVDEDPTSHEPQNDTEALDSRPLEAVDLAGSTPAENGWDSSSDQQEKIKECSSEEHLEPNDPSDERSESTGDLGGSSETNSSFDAIVIDDSLSDGGTEGSNTKGGADAMNAVEGIDIKGSDVRESNAEESDTKESNAEENIDVENAGNAKEGVGVKTGVSAPGEESDDKSTNNEFEVISVSDEDLESPWLDPSNEEKWGSEDIN